MNETKAANDARAAIADELLAQGTVRSFRGVQAGALMTASVLRAGAKAARPHLGEGAHYGRSKDIAKNALAWLKRRGVVVSPQRGYYVHASNESLAQKAQQEQLVEDYGKNMDKVEKALEQLQQKHGEILAIVDPTERAEAAKRLAMAVSRATQVL